MNYRFVTLIAVIFLFIPLMGQAQNYSGDGQYTLLFATDTVTIDNGLLFTPIFNESGPEVTVSFSVKSNSGQTLGQTDYLSIGEIIELEWGGELSMIRIYNAGNATGTPWTHVEFTSVESGDDVVVSNVEIDNQTFRREGASAYITWDTNFITSGNIVFCEGVSNCSSPREASSAFATSTHGGAVLLELKYSTKYYYQMEGYVSSSLSEYTGDWMSFTTLRMPISSIQPYNVIVEIDNVLITWRTDEISEFELQYGINSVDENSMRNAGSPTSITMEPMFWLENLQKQTTYKYRLIMWGNTGLFYSDIFTFNYIGEELVVNLYPLEITATTYTFRYDTNIPCKTYFDYQSWDKLQSWQFVESGYVTEHVVTLTNLQPSTNYWTSYTCKNVQGVVILNQALSQGTISTEAVDAPIPTPAPTPTPSPSPTPTPEPTLESSDDVIVREQQRQQETNQTLVSNVLGKILLQVEENGEAWYVNPVDQKRAYLGRPWDAFSIMRGVGLGISNADLAKIPVAVIDGYSGHDTDGDGLPDTMEEALGTGVNTRDSDGDGYDDGTEINNDFNPLGAGRRMVDYDFSGNLAGRILIQVESNGEAWYVSPDNSKRYYLGRPADAFNIMRQLGLGITNDNLNQIPL